MNRSRIASWVALVYAVTGTGMLLAGVPIGWASPFILVAVTAKALAVRWGKAETAVLPGMLPFTEEETAALDGQACLVAVMRATPRLEHPR